MEILINPTAQRVWRTQQALQIGWGEGSVVLENLLPRHEIFIEALYRGLTQEQAYTYARHLKMRMAETRALLEALRPVLLRQTSRTRPLGPNGQTLETDLPSKNYAQELAPRQDSAAYVNALGEMNQCSANLSARGESVWLQRQKRSVFIGLLDPLGQIIAMALARAGIGAIVFGDQNNERTEALKLNLELLPLRPKLLFVGKLKEHQLSKIDLAILTGQQLIEPQKFAAWANRGTPALGAILASAAENLNPFIGHIMIAGSTPCWVCLEQHRKQHDLAWPDMASQLVGRELPFDSASATLSLAAQVVEATLGHIDGLNGFNPTAQQLRWDFHQDCACRLLGPGSYDL